MHLYFLFTGLEIFVSILGRVFHVPSLYIKLYYIVQIILLYIHVYIDESLIEL